MTNNNIVVTLGRTAGKCFVDGILAKQGQDKVLADWMGTSPKELKLSADKGAAKLFKTDGTYMD